MTRIAWKLCVVLVVSVLRLIDSILPGAKQIRRRDPAAGHGGGADPAPLQDRGYWRRT